MSDREFDNQFKDKFENFEFEPSSSIWDRINSDLSASEKKPFPWFSIAAASMAAVIAAGIWFAPHKKPMKLYGKAKTEEVKERIEEMNISEDSPIVVSANEVEIVKNKPVRTNHADEPAVESAYMPESKEKPVAMAQGVEEAVQIAGNQQDQTEPLLIPEVRSEVSVRKRPSQDMLAFNPGPEDTTLEKSKRKIRSVGDLVNFVVGKVDKRKNKIIEFSKDDEGEEISGLNLGLLQYRTRNN